MEEKKKSLKERKQDLLRRRSELIALENEDVIRVRSRGYLRELQINYSREDHRFLPGEFMWDKGSKRLSICLGVGLSPNVTSFQAVWFLTEGDSDISFIDTHNVPAQLQEKFMAMQC